MLIYNITPSATPYRLSYSELKEDFNRFEAMTDEKFLANLKEIIHFACICGWLKELGPDATISDEGIIHNLIHLWDGSVDINIVRDQFDLLLKLV